MTNGTGLLVGALVFAAGGGVGWVLRSGESGSASPRTDTRPASRELLDELHALRAEVRALAARSELAPQIGRAHV